MLHFILCLSKVLKVGGKQKPYQMWQAGISPLANFSRSPATEYGGPLARSRIPPATQAMFCVTFIPTVKLPTENHYGYIKENKRITHDGVYPGLKEMVKTGNRSSRLSLWAHFCGGVLKLRQITRQVRNI